MVSKLGTRINTPEFRVLEGAQALRWVCYGFRCVTLPLGPGLPFLWSLSAGTASDHLYIGPVTALVCSQTPVPTHPNSCPRPHLHSGSLRLSWTVATPSAGSSMPLLRGPLNASKPAHPPLCSAISFRQFLVLAISSPSCPRSLAWEPSSAPRVPSPPEGYCSLLSLPLPA